MRGPFDPSGPQPVWWRRAVLWLVVAAIVFFYFVAGAIWGSDAVPWVLGGYLLIFMGVAFRQALRLGRREWEASLTFPIQSEPTAGFTPLEVEAIAAIGDAAAGRSALVANLASAEVGLRWNTGSGCLVTVFGAAPALADPSILDAVAWFSLDGASAPVGFRIWHTEGVVDLIEAFCDGYQTADIDWRKAAFVALPTSLDHRNPSLRPHVGAWMSEEIQRAVSDDLFKQGEVRLR